MATKKESFDPKLLITGVLAFGIIWFGRKIAMKTGLIQSQQAQQQQQLLANLEASDFWDLALFKSKVPRNTNYKAVTAAAAYNLAEKIYDATGYFNDDEEAIYSVFRSLTTQSQVPFVADAFRKKYNKDLYFFLKDTLNEDELTNIANIINAKPVYWP